jgi:S-adenosylmethionine hydrolase
LPIITLTSDYGFQSHYLVKLKAHLISGIPNVQLVDVMHDAQPFHLDEALFMLKNTLEHFSDKTIHIMGIGAQNSANSVHMLGVCNGQYVFAPNNGFLPLLFGDQDAQFYDFVEDYKPGQDIVVDVYSNRAKQLVETDFEISEELYKPAMNYLIKMTEKPVSHGNSMRVAVAYTDHFGNVFSNLTQSQFEEWTNGKRFAIRISRDEFIYEISNDYSQVRRGEVLARFGPEKVLQISVNSGNASQLFALKKGDYFMIELNG